MSFILNNFWCNVFWGATQCPSPAEMQNHEFEYKQRCSPRTEHFRVSGKCTKKKSRSNRTDMKCKYPYLTRENRAFLNILTKGGGQLPPQATLTYIALNYRPMSSSLHKQKRAPAAKFSSNRL